MLDGNNSSIHPTLDGWVYIDPIHGPLDGPLYTWAQYTPTEMSNYSMIIEFYYMVHVHHTFDS